MALSFPRSLADVVAESKHNNRLAKLFTVQTNTLARYTIHNTRYTQPSLTCLRKALSNRKYFERLSFRDIGPDILMIGIIDKQDEVFCAPTV